MPDDEIVAKFRTLAGQRLDHDGVARILSTVETLDQASTVDELFDSLTIPKNRIDG